jgi:hypothetical protein
LKNERNMDFLMPIVKTTVLYIHKPKWLTGKYRITTGCNSDRN